MVTAGQWRDAAGKVVDMYTPGAAYYGAQYDPIDWGLPPAAADEVVETIDELKTEAKYIPEGGASIGGAPIGSDDWFDEFGIEPAKYDSFEDFLNEMGFEDVPDLVAEWGLPALATLLVGPLGGMLAYYAQQNPQWLAEIDNNLSPEMAKTLETAVEAQTAAYGPEPTEAEQAEAAANLADIVASDPNVVGFTGEGVAPEPSLSGKDFASNTYVDPTTGLITPTLLEDFSPFTTSLEGAPTLTTPEAPVDPTDPFTHDLVGVPQISDLPSEAFADFDTLDSFESDPAVEALGDHFDNPSVAEAFSEISAIEGLDEEVIDLELDMFEGELTPTQKDDVRDALLSTISTPSIDVAAPAVDIASPISPVGPNISGITDAQTEADLAEAESYFSLGLDELSPDVANNVTDFAEMGYDAEALAASAPRANNTWGLNMTPVFSTPIGTISLPNITTPYDVTDKEGRPASFDAVGVVTDRDGNPIATRDKGVLTYGTPKTAYEKAQLEREVAEAKEQLYGEKKAPVDVDPAKEDVDVDIEQDPDVNLEDTAYTEDPDVNLEDAAYTEEAAPVDMDEALFDEAFDVDNPTNFGVLGEAPPRDAATWGTYDEDGYDEEAEGETSPDEPEDLSSWTETEEDADALSVNYDPSLAAYDYIDMSETNLDAPDVSVDAPTAPDRSGWAADTDLSDEAYSEPDVSTWGSYDTSGPFGVDPEAEGEGSYDSTPSFDADTWGSYDTSGPFGVDPEAEGESFSYDTPFGSDTAMSPSISSWGGVDAFTSMDSYSTDPDTNMDDSTFDDDSSSSDSGSDSGSDGGDGSDCGCSCGACGW